MKVYDNGIWAVHACTLRVPICKNVGSDRYYETKFVAKSALHVDACFVGKEIRVASWTTETQRAHVSCHVPMFNEN